MQDMAGRLMRFLVLPLVVLCATAVGSEATTKMHGVPQQIKTLLDSSGVSARWEVDRTSKPLYLQGDFDGDGTLDYAVWLISKRDGTPNFAVILNNQTVRLITSEKEIGHNYPGSDWRLHPRKDAVKSRRDLNEGHGAPHLHGDAIEVAKTDSSSALLYWHKGHLCIYWLSD